MRSDHTVDARPPQDWNVLRTLCWFRTLLSLLLLYVQPQGRLIYEIERISTSTFSLISGAYAVFGVVLIALLWRRLSNFDSQVTAHVAGDLAFIGMLAMLVDGLTQTVAILLCVPLAAAVLLRRPRLLYALAAIASGLLLVAEFSIPPFQRNLYATFALTLAFFAVAQLSVLHIQRIHQADTALQAQNLELSSLTDLADEILSVSTQGMIVLDKTDHVRFVNASALMLLDTDYSPAPVHLKRLSHATYDALRTQSDIVKDADGFPILRMHTSTLRGGNTLISLIDLREIEAMTEQVRLASLGRWSASLAHEIRNPLSAISQSLQLLEADRESDQYPKLISIMQRNTGRIEAVVKDVLTLSRPPAELQPLSISDWANEFFIEFKLAHPEADISLEDCSHSGGQILGDDKRIYHIVSNLCENALAHGDKTTIKLSLTSDTQPAGARHSLTVANPGEALTPAQQKRMFEPFFTTSVRGSGLGLFVVRELSEQLGYQLNYRYHSGLHELTLSAPALLAQDLAA